MTDETYDDGRARALEAMLLALAERIRALQAGGQLLDHAGELTKLIGDVRSELFHYEVRITYDTPEIADSRRLVDEAQAEAEATESSWEKTEWTQDEGDGTKW